jgi:hypothetical protein
MIAPVSKQLEEVVIPTNIGATGRALADAITVPDEPARNQDAKR